jgi:cation:H+ antiporter
MDVLLVLIGLVGLYFGGELLVRHASHLARLLGVAPMVIGLTVVAFGTSAPELAATLAAALRGAPELGVSNVVGSNVANVGLILALTALVYPLRATWSFLRREVAWMLTATALAAALLADGTLLRWEGLVLTVFLGAFLVWSFRVGAAPRVDDEDAPRSRAGLPRMIAWLLLGLALLAYGAQALVAGATSLATAWGVPERVIGLTLVAVGTSLPELASSLVAALRRETDIILGNVIGSNLFNLAAVLGIAALIHPIAVPAAALRIDLLVMAAFAIVIVPLIAWRLRLSRRDGLVLLAAYGLYLGWLF